MNDLHFALISVFNAPDRHLLGNPAAVVYSEQPLSDAQMQAWSALWHQPATTFLRPLGNDKFAVRWFAPDAEIGLCGHGSAAALVYLHRFRGKEQVGLESPGGKLGGKADGRGFELEIEPIEVVERRPAPAGLAEALGTDIVDYFQTANKDLVLLKNESQLKKVQADFTALAKLPPFGYVLTAPGEEVDFVSRTLVPKVQQREDHATGSSHAILVPFWSERLQKRDFSAIQHSPRGGFFRAAMGLSKVLLRGEYRLEAEGRMHL